ncbi:response regulator [Burkholderia pyrrocinia]|uniref:response regulator n=1 Tax=Burkholderia pyrrocinia TaxID=60550 RepID=UPI00050189EE|nr:response regulator transcription factor [Burkholderia pyrrocinia]KFL49840.1 LuxR family transcriptional regulator [Burkholderia pyrrocinia]TDA42367.1 response regulator transcription factor [Burkholderia pyrrocinia]
MKSIVLAEDHAIIRDGLKLLLQTRANWQVVGETGDGQIAARLVRDTQADLLLLDLDLPGYPGIELAKQIKAQSPQTRILVVTGNQNPVTVRAAVAIGVDGYMLKHEDGDELLHAISLVLSGIRYISDALAHVLENAGGGAAPPPVTAREKEILVLIANGHSSKEIATRLNLSVLTVRKHRQNLMTKLSLHNVAEVTAYAIRDGLAELPLPGNLRAEELLR